jgi:O-antigen ligase
VTALVVLVLLTIALALATRWACLALGRPHLWPAALLFLAAPLEVYRADVGAFNLSLFRVALVVALVPTTVELLRRGRPRLPLPAPLWLYGGLVAIQLLSVTFVSTTPSLGRRFVLQYLGGLVAAIVVLAAVRRDNLLNAVQLFVASLFVPACASVYRVLAPGEPGSPRTLPGLDLLPLDTSIQAAREQGSFLLSGVQRFQGTFADPNHFGFFVGVAVVLLLALTALEWRGGDRRRIAAALLALGSASVLLLGTYSRSAWLLTVVAVAAWFALAGRATLKGTLGRRGIAILGGVALVVAIVAAPAVSDRVDPGNSGTAISNAQHQQTMDLAIALTQDRPLTGVGLGSFGSYANQPPLVSSSHSTQLSVAAELGLPGLALLLGAMLTTACLGISAVVRARDVTRRAVLAGLTAAYVGMAVANTVYEVWTDDFQWMLFGLLVGAATGQDVQSAVALPHPLRLAPPRGAEGSGALGRVDAC